MEMQFEDQLWYIWITKSKVPNRHNHYWRGASGQQNRAICTIIWRIACVGTKIFAEDQTMFPDASNYKAQE